MKRSLFFLSFLLFGAVALVAQPRVSSNTEMYNLGQIEWKHPLTVEYTITNTGNEPLVLTNVTTSCACAVPEWTQTPIPPGQKGAIKATFDAKALGHFEKTVGVYSNAIPSLVYLKFAGEVVRVVKDFTKTLPFAIGNIRTDCDEFTFPDVRRGQTPSITFHVANLSDGAYEPVLMHLPAYLKMVSEPNVLQKGEKGTVTLTLDTEQLKDYGLTQTAVYLSRFAGDKVSSENEIPVSVVLLPDFPNLTKRDSLDAPSLHLSETNIDLSLPLIKKTKASYEILIANAGKKPLKISKLQVFNPSVSVSLKKKELPPDGMTTMLITVRKRDEENKKQRLRILMITNDPLRPKVEINIKR